jgi:branched-chain amino acid transport system ATP-binding protein
MLALARALAVPPKLIIADEVSLGLAPLIVDAVFETLKRVRDEGTTVILIEQFVHRALSLADRCAIMHQGSVAWVGAAADAQPHLLDHYYVGPTAPDGRASTEPV